MASTPRARPGSYGRTLIGVVRKFAFVPAYRPDQALTLVTADGLRLAGALLEGPPAAFATVVLVHGFSHSSRTPGIHAFAHLLARHARVVVPDLRGHGRSEGVCTLGGKEPLDVEAAVVAGRAGRPDLPVVTVGVSLGGAAVLLHAGLRGPNAVAGLRGPNAKTGLAGVVAVSAPSRWGAWESPATRRVNRYATTWTGRVLLARALRTRIAHHCEAVPDARDVVAAIAPAFTLIVHDPSDHYFSPEHAETLYAWAQEPKDLWWETDAGHGTDLLTTSLADRLVAELRRRCVPGAVPPR